MLNLLFAWILAAFVAGCTTAPVPTAPVQGGTGPAVQQNPSLRVAVLDYFLSGDLSDPEIMAKYSRADLLITQPNLFWGRDGYEQKIAQLRTANPNLKIVGYFRSKCIRQEWATLARGEQTYLYDLYHAATPFLSYTTAGDTLQDWPGVANFDFTDPDARNAMLDVFVAYQQNSTAKLDGIFWDYFGPSLWISPDVVSMEGEPDMDGDGVAHAVDADEIVEFKAAQTAWVMELRARLGEGFIQVANGGRALQDSTFAGLFDGMLYEIFPNVGFAADAPYRHALDPSVPHNLWAANRWLRTGNGGPWQLLENPWVPQMMDQNGVYRAIDLGDINRAVALLTGATVIHYDLSGSHRAGVPSVEVNLGSPLGGVAITGNTITRTFEHGLVSLTMDSGRYPMGFSFTIESSGQDVIQSIELGYMYP